MNIHSWVKVVKGSLSLTSTEFQSKIEKGTMSEANFIKSRYAFWPRYFLLLLAAVSVSLFFPLLFIVLPVVFAHLFLVLFRAKPLENQLLPFCLLAPLCFRSPPF